MAQAQRERTINQLKSGRLDVLVATDVAARGLDVDRISHVVNFDIPTDTESYVHRIGRTGRAGRSGEAISFVTPRERRLLRDIERATGQSLELVPVPSAEDVNATRLSRFDGEITQALASDRLAFFRAVVGHYVEEFDVPALDVAAALALRGQGEQPLLLEPDPEPSERRGRDRDRADQDERGGAGQRTPRGDTPALAAYRIAVGKRHRITPRHIVGALANEGGLRREDFGHIDIRLDHSIVELPAALSQDAWDALRTTRISGRLIDLTPASARDREGGHPGQRSGPNRDKGFHKRDRFSRYDRPKKPRRKG